MTNLNKTIERRKKEFKEYWFINNGELKPETFLDIEAFISSLLSAFAKEMIGEEKKSEKDVNWKCPKCTSYVMSWNAEGKYCSNCRRKLVKEVFVYPNREDEGSNLKRQELIKIAKKYGIEEMEENEQYNHDKRRTVKLE